MPAKVLVIAFSLTLSLATCSFAIGERISDDDFGSSAAALEEPTAEAPPEPAKEPARQRYSTPGLAETVVGGPWQTPEQAPTMMESVSGVCQESCEPCCPRGGWVGGAGVYVIKPHWTTNPAYAATNILGGVSVDTQTDFPYSYYATPLVWFGYVGENGLGARTRFWLFDQSSTVPAYHNDFGAFVLPAAPLNDFNSSIAIGDVLTFNSGLNVDVADFELTQTFQAGALTGQLFAGGRYARIEQTYHYVKTPLNAPDDIINSRHTFNGFGPSVGAEVRRSIQGSGISLYANGRGSLLFGKSSQVASSILGLANGGFFRSGSYANWDVIPTVETELGILWQKDTDRGRMFVDAGIVGIAFFGAGNAANNGMIIHNGGYPVADKNATLGFFGFKLAAGMSY
jgi:hypothetical protein